MSSLLQFYSFFLQIDMGYVVMGFDLERAFQILNDVTGKLDARKACKEALKIHKKYLLKVYI